MNTTDSDLIFATFITILILSYKIFTFDVADNSIVVLYFLLPLVCLSAIISDGNPYYELGVMCVAFVAHFIYIILTYSNLAYYCIMGIIVITLLFFRIMLKCVMLLIREYDDENYCKTRSFVNMK